MQPSEEARANPLGMAQVHEGPREHCLLWGNQPENALGKTTGTSTINFTPPLQKPVLSGHQSSL